MCTNFLDTRVANLVRVHWGECRKVKGVVTSYTHARDIHGRARTPKSLLPKAEKAFAYETMVTKTEVAALKNLSHDFFFHFLG